MSWIQAIKTWQGLLAAFISAAALVYTVYVTLSIERRREERELGALRVALGAEIRQFAQRALRAHTEVVPLLAAHAAPASVPVSLRHLRRAARFAEPVVFTQTAGKIGTLGEFADGVVYFYGAISVMKEVLYRLGDRLDAGSALPEGQCLAVAEGFLVAAERAVKVLPAFASRDCKARDEQFAKDVEAARKEFDKLNAQQQG